MSSVRLDCEFLTGRPRVRADARRVLLGAGVIAVAGVVLLLLGSPSAPLGEMLDRLRAADALAIGITVLAEAGSFAGYVLLTWLVVGRRAPRIGLAVSGQATMAGAAITRLLPPAGLSGVGLTLWALRRAGRSATQATRRRLPVPAGLVAQLALRRNVRRWTREDEGHDGTPVAPVSRARRVARLRLRPTSIPRVTTDGRLE